MKTTVALTKRKEKYEGVLVEIIEGEDVRSKVEENNRLGMKSHVILCNDQLVQKPSLAIIEHRPSLSSKFQMLNHKKENDAKTIRS